MAQEVEMKVAPTQRMTAWLEGYGLGIEQASLLVHRILEFLHPYLDTGDSRTAPDWAVGLAAIVMADDTPKPRSGALKESEVEWVVNDLGELGVRIAGKCFFLYKGESLVYHDAVHDNGAPIHVRTVGKREFGETAHPINYNNPALRGTVSLSDSDRWEVMQPQLRD